MEHLTILLVELRRHGAKIIGEIRGLTRFIDGNDYCFFPWSIKVRKAKRGVEYTARVH